MEEKLPRTEGSGKWGVTVNVRVSLWDDENVLEMDGADGCPTMYLMPLNCTPNNQHGKFCYVSYHSKKKNGFFKPIKSLF